jgi:hypothetical protein
MSNFYPYDYPQDPYFYNPGTFMEANKDADLYADPLLRLQASALTDGWGYDVPQGMPTTTPASAPAPAPAPGYGSGTEPGYGYGYGYSSGYGSGSGSGSGYGYGYGYGTKPSYGDSGPGGTSYSGSPVTKDVSYGSYGSIKTGELKPEDRIVYSPKDNKFTVVQNISGIKTPSPSNFNLSEKKPDDIIINGEGLGVIWSKPVQTEIIKRVFPDKNVIFNSNRVADLDLNKINLMIRSTHPWYKSGTNWTEQYQSMKDSPELNYSGDDPFYRKYNGPYICISGEPFRCDLDDKSKPPIIEMNTYLNTSELTKKVDFKSIELKEKSIWWGDKFYNFSNNITNLYLPYIVWGTNVHFPLIPNKKLTNFRSIRRDIYDDLKEGENALDKKKYDFVYLASNCTNKIREDLMKKLQAKNEKDCLNTYGENCKDEQKRARAIGKCSNNAPFPQHLKISGMYDNWKAYNDYKFVFALENSINPGYITEKILIAFESNAVPIYYGTDEIFKYFNKKSFFYLNEYFSDPNNPTQDEIEIAATKLRILATDNSENGWKKFLKQPIYKNNKIPELFTLLDDDNKLIDTYVQTFKKNYETAIASLSNSKYMKEKYFKYKNKYLKLKEIIQKGGTDGEPIDPVEPGKNAPKDGCYVYLSHPEGEELKVSDGIPSNKWHYDAWGQQERIDCNTRRKNYQSHYKPKYGTLSIIAKKDDVLPNIPIFPTEPGCYVYLSHPEGKDLKVSDGVPTNEWYYDEWGHKQGIDCDIRRGNYQSHYNPEYGTLSINNSQPPPPVPPPAVAPAVPAVAKSKYNPDTGVINEDILSQILSQITELPPEATAEIKSAMVWGALNREHTTNSKPGTLGSIPENLLIKYITGNDIMRNGNPVNNPQTCEFVNKYNILSLNPYWVNDTMTKLGLPL